MKWIIFKGITDYQNWAYQSKNLEKPISVENRKKLRNYPHRKESGPDGSKWSLPSFRPDRQSQGSMYYSRESERETSCSFYEANITENYTKDDTKKMIKLLTNSTHEYWYKNLKQILETESTTGK